jgi:hypothetical protein
VPGLSNLVAFRLLSISVFVFHFPFCDGTIIINGEWIRNWKEIIVMYVKAIRLFQSCDRSNEAKPPTICGNIAGNSLKVSPETA